MTRAFEFAYVYARAGNLGHVVSPLHLLFQRLTRSSGHFGLIARRDI